MHFYSPIKNKVIIVDKLPLIRSREEGWYIIPSKWGSNEIREYFKGKVVFKDTVFGG